MGKRATESEVAIVHGFLNLNKPAGWTSHDCVARVRKLLREKRVGHAGTLDPAATGVLPIAVGRATRLLQYLSTDKAYRATIRFGVRTTTDDLEGEILSAEPAPQLDLQTVQRYLPKFQGTIEQIPPAYSAIQVQGKRLYDLARSGQAVEAPLRTVEIYQIEVLDWRSQDYPELVVQIACGTGTYIRSIARDLGDAIGVGGTLAALQRTASSGFDLADSMTLEDLELFVQTPTFQLIPPDRPLEHLPSIELPDEAVIRWCHGQRLAASAFQLSAIPALHRLYDTSGRFLGIGEGKNDVEPLLVPRLVFHPSSESASENPST